MSYQRRYSTVAHVGNITIGGNNPIRIQSMATTDTNDTEGCVAQAKRIIDAGGELVRFTTQGTREAENMKNISARLKADGYQTPLVADVHFTAHTADVAAQYCEKVRINPGNYVDPGRTFKHLEYTDEEYAAELQKIEAKLVPFLNICKEHHTAIRIGVNHGSLSDRIMSRYGDTPEGIVESCMEFLRICRREQFNDVVISIKASNTVVMVITVRLLVKTMDQEDMHYPLHLGVTEAGEGEDGRIKSAVGIGALLTEGIGDTIRVSLSEEPEYEIPVARKLVDMIEECARLRAEAEASIKDDTITLNLDSEDWETLQLKAAMAVGALLIDRKATKLELRAERFTRSDLQSLADAILQAARIKFTKTEYISCPGCGRTLYNLQETIARIKAATSHLVGLKIGIMGCIVNGPGEMADADYGYVGAGRGKISLYKQKVCVEKNIPEEEAVEKLLELIEKDRASK
jgi:(E)-4-hydroxy-3-methylbut-2-enyl-diphosphate synthase